MNRVSVQPLNGTALTKIKLQIETRSNPGVNASVSKTRGPNKRKRIMPGLVRISETPGTPARRRGSAKMGRAQLGCERIARDG